ncbi:MAG TPA: polysaccharide pyruvyl transferase family protein [Polyangiaceae bacterium]|nr:polysaccharide pyruvyl transferase family protein [Polyangiaceae bacterium]
MADERIRIGISGSYGGMNLGDEAILEGILGELRASIDADITVFSKNPKDTLARHDVERSVSPATMTRREMIPEIEQLDLFVLGGGGILYDAHAEEYLREVTIANQLGVPVLLYAISAGPLTTQTSRRAIRTALNVSPEPVITVRDRMGYRLLEDVGVQPDIHLTADPAFLLEADELPLSALRSEGVDVDQHLVGFSVREPGPAAPDINPETYYALLANSADFMVQRYDTNVVFVPMEKSDVQHSHAVVAHMQHSERAEILRRRYSPRQIIDLMGRFDFAVGMRLHFLIFAALRGTPFAALPYASKVTGLLEDLDMPSPPLESIGIGQLIAEIDRSWDTRAALSAKIREKVPRLRARARLTNELLLRLVAARRGTQRQVAQTLVHPAEHH